MPPGLTKNSYRGGALVSPLKEVAIHSKAYIRIALSFAVFVGAAAIVYVAVDWTTPPKAASKTQDTLEGVEGLQTGDVVSLPELTSRTGERVTLSDTKTDKLLCVFFTPSCSGCMKDVELWQDLQQEAARQRVAFFVIDVGSDADALKKFSDTYGLGDLPILVDPTRTIGRNLKVNFVPQYLLFDQKGSVLHRWDGIRHYERNSATSSDQLRQFFAD